MPRYVVIEDPADSRVQPFVQVRERDLVGRDGGFIAEGEVVLRTAIRAGRHPIKAVLLAQKRLAGLSDALDALPEDVVVFQAAQSVLDAIVGFHIHRGILALGERRPDPDPASMLRAMPPRALVLGLFGIGNHDNMGGVFRNAAAFGVDAVLLDAACCDPLYRKAIRVSVGAALTTPFARVDGDMLTLLQAEGFEALALTPAGSQTLSRSVRPPRAAVLLGAEGPGLPDDVMGRARSVSIPMAGSFDSLNVATTSGIVLHHMVFGAAGSSQL